MTVLGEKDGIDTELLTFAMTLINKTLSNVPDQDTFYDITDSLEKQNIDEISQVVLVESLKMLIHNILYTCLI